MTFMTAAAPDRSLTRADWEAMPEHNRKTELLDGELVEMTMPKMVHQDVVSNLNDVLKAAAPPGIKVRFAPVAVHIGDRIILEPDLVVGSKELFLPRGLEQPPLLVVEVLSPSTRRRDLIRKFTWFQEFGIRHAWFVDPDEPSITAWELVEGHYVEVSVAVGNETLVVERPFPLEITPNGLFED